MFRRIVIALALFALAGLALAGAKESLHASMSKFLQFKSFKATMTDLTRNKTMSVVEFQAPDRYRISIPDMPASVIIGGTMYMNQGGQTMKIPMPAQMLGQYRNEAAIKEIEQGAIIDDLGLELLAGTPAHKYRMTVKKPTPSSTLIWVSVKSNAVMQFENSGKANGKPYAMRVVYSNYNDPAIKITAPN